MAKEQAHAEKPSLVARLLGVFTSIEGPECRISLLLTLNVFLLLTAYYLLKTVREPLILVGGGAEVKSYSAAVQALLMLGAVPLYAKLVDSLDRQKLVNSMSLFYIVNLGIFYLLARLGVPNLGVAFFIWVGIFSLTILAQFWSLANDLFTVEAGKRIFPLVAVGSNVGAIFGAWAAVRLLKIGIGVYELMLIAGVVLLVYVLLTTIIIRSQPTPAVIPEAPVRPEAVAKPAADKVNGLTLVLRDRYLLLIAVLMFLTNLVNTNGEYILGRVVTATAHDLLPGAGDAELSQYIGVFYGNFFLAVNTLGAILQALAVSRIIRYAGVPIALLVLPVIALGSYALMAASATLVVIRTAKILENSTDYSLQNTTRHALFLPTGTAAKYKGKQVIDTFFVRMGDVVSALLVLVGVTFDLSVNGFAAINVALVVVWLVVAVGIGRRFTVLTRRENP